MTYLSFLQSSSLGYRDKDDEIKKNNERNHNGKDYEM